ncbi:MAG: PAS domain-containing protein [Campylobacterota bacterium]|nr:PAS domain-containing protein [Campylobacterota bacterium]
MARIDDCKELVNIQKQLKKYELITSSVPFPMSIVNKDYTYEVVNKAYSKYLNHSIEDIIGNKIGYFLGEEVFEKEIKPNIDRALSGEVIEYTIEVDFETIGRRCMKMSYIPHKEKDGTINSIISYGQDITNENKYKETILFSTNYSNSIFDAIPNIIIASDGEEMDKANQVMLDFLGFESIESFKKEHDCICDYFENKDGYIKPNMNGMKWLDYVLKNKDEIHKVCIIKNNVEHIFLLTARLLEFDEKKRSIAVFTDISYLTQVETNLKQSEINLSRIIDNSPLAIFVIDKLHNVIHWNKECESLTNVKKEDILGTKNHGEIFYKKQRPTMTDIMIDGNKQEQIEKYYKGKYKISSKSNSIFEAEDFFPHLGEDGKWLSFSATPITDNSAEVIASVEILKDITEDKKILEKLHEQEKLMLTQSRQAAMGEMISMIAHQWRQPLSIISMDANNIIADIELESLNEDVLKSTSFDIIRQTKELSKTIDDFKNFFKPNQEKEFLKIDDVIKDTIAVIGKSLKNNNIKLIITGDINSQINTFSRELMQVLMNIINNAKEAIVYNSIKDGYIKVEVKKYKNNLNIRISDNAKGIQKDIINKIFEPYFSTKELMNGTGLGLYISKTIIENHLQGKIEVENNQDGAVFNISLPLD